MSEKKRPMEATLERFDAERSDAMQGDAPRSDAMQEPYGTGTAPEPERAAPRRRSTWSEERWVAAVQKAGLADALLRAFAKAHRDKRMDKKQFTRFRKRLRPLLKEKHAEAEGDDGGEGEEGR